MEIFGYLIGALIVVGAALAIYERRKGKVLLRHDFNADTRGQSETDREGMRTSEKLLHSQGGEFNPDR